MKTYSNIAFIIICSLAMQAANAQKVLVLKSHLIAYKVKNAGFNSFGQFDKMTASVAFDEENLDKSMISATLLVSSFNSGIRLRDKHLKSEDYFDLQKYPTITLVSTKIAKTKDGYLGTFDLTIKAVSKSIQLPFTVTKNGGISVFKTNELVIDRLIYGLGKASLTLGNTVYLNLEATFTNE